MRNKKLWILLLAYLGSTHLLHAADEWYQIEVIIFQQKNPSTSEYETLPANTLLPDTSGATSLVDGSKGIKVLSGAHYSMKKQYSQLAGSSHFNPLIHLAWRQPIKFRQQGQKVLIQGGKVLSRSVGTPEASPQPATPPNTDTLMNPNEEGNAPRAANPPSTALTPPLYELSGTIALSRGRMLILDADLVYYQTGGSIPPARTGGRAQNNSDLKLFRMIEKRHMRSREINFLDHPAFGMLVQVRSLSNNTSAE